MQFFWYEIIFYAYKSTYCLMKTPIMINKTALLSSFTV